VLHNLVAWHQDLGPRSWREGRRRTAAQNKNSWTGGRCRRRRDARPQRLTINSDGKVDVEASEISCIGGVYGCHRTRVHGCVYPGSTDGSRHCITSLVVTQFTSINSIRPTCMSMIQHGNRDWLNWSFSCPKSQCAHRSPARSSTAWVPARGTKADVGRSRLWGHGTGLIMQVPEGLQWITTRPPLTAFLSQPMAQQISRPPASGLFFAIPSPVLGYRSVTVRSLNSFGAPDNGVHFVSNLELDECTHR
jgi:hypothetical protein